MSVQLISLGNSETIYNPGVIENKEFKILVRKSFEDPITKDNFVESQPLPESVAIGTCKLYNMKLLDKPIIFNNYDRLYDWLRKFEENQE